MRRVLVTVVAVAAISLGLAVVATALTDHHGASQDAAIRYVRCRYDRRSNRVIAMATLTNPNGSAVSFTVRCGVHRPGSRGSWRPRSSAMGHDRNAGEND